MLRAISNYLFACGLFLKYCWRRLKSILHLLFPPFTSTAISWYQWLWKSRLPPPFPFLKLPHVVKRIVLNQINGEKLIHLSLQSKVFKRELEYNKLHCDRLLISIHSCINYILIQIPSSRLTLKFDDRDSNLEGKPRIIFKKCQVNGSSITIKDGPRTEVFVETLQHLIEILNFTKIQKIKASIYSGTELLELKKFWKLPLKFKKFEIKPVKKAEDVKLIVKNVNAKYVEIEDNPDFSLVKFGSIKFCEVDLQCPINLSFENFDQSSIKDIYLTTPCSKILNDLNKFLKSWMKGKFPNLTSLWITGDCSGRLTWCMLPKDVILDGIEYTDEKITLNPFVEHHIRRETDGVVGIVRIKTHALQFRLENKYL